MRPAEIIVVDDGSADDTAGVAQRHNQLVRVIRQPHRGVGAATTRAIRETVCPVFAAVDADDVWLPGKIARQLAHLEANPGCRGTFTHLRTFRTDGLLGSADMVSPGWCRTTMMMYTAAALEVGEVIDPPGGRGDMVDWIGRAREMGVRLDMLSEVLVRRRVHISSLSYGRDAARDKGYVRVGWMALRRRRAARP